MMSNGWCPMNRAPKDGTEVLLLDTEGNRQVGRWKSGPVLNKAGELEQMSYWVFGMARIRDEAAQLRFWQPLPHVPPQDAPVRTLDEVMRNQVERAMKTFPFRAYHEALEMLVRNGVGGSLRDGGIFSEELLSEGCFIHTVQDLMRVGRDLLERAALGGARSWRSAFLMSVRHESDSAIMLELHGDLACSHHSSTPYVGDIWYSEGVWL